MRIPRRIVPGAICALALGLVGLGSAVVSNDQSQPELPISDTAAQVAFENEVAAFLASSEEPSRSDFPSDVDGQNAYWRAMGTWWESIPWHAVAGQWGCTIQSDTVTFNPVDQHGVVTAGHGGIGTCGGVDISDAPAIFTVPDTRSNIISQDPEAFS
jgi:hypothetical protein